MEIMINILLYFTSAHFISINSRIDYNKNKLQLIFFYKYFLHVIVFHYETINESNHKTKDTGFNQY